MRTSKDIMIYIPTAIVEKLDAYLMETPPKFLYKKESFYYILHFLITQKIKNPKKVYIPLNINFLKRIIGYNTLNYIKTLKNGEIIISDKKYEKGVKSFWYKLNYDISGESIEITIDPHSKLGKRIVKSSRKSKAHYNRLKPHLRAMQREFMNLDMDFDKAREWIDTCSDPVKRSSYLTSLNHIEDKRFRYFKRNTTNGRLDTNLTNLKSDLRQFIKGDYVSIDSKNSQPFLLSKLTDTIINNNSTLCCILSNANLSKSFGVRALQKVLLIHQKHLKQPFSPNLVNLSLFKKSTTDGAFYEGFMEQYGNGIERNKVKDIMFNVLFSEDKIYDKKNRWRDKDKDIFSSIYPFVFEVIKILKKKDHAMLAIFLQQLESYIFIDCIAKKLVENGIIPFTIHDSVIVKSKDQTKALKIIQSIFKKQLGVVPSFHVKPLRSESNSNQIDLLKSKTMALTKLPNSFKGKGEVSGFSFNMEYENEKGYVFRVNSGDSLHYETFYKKQVPICIDFKKRIYSETDFKETYPKSNSFGEWAWTVASLEKGIERITFKT